MTTFGELSVVTGALGYTGRYIARALLERGARVRTLTAHPSQPNPFGERLEIAPMDFGSPERLTRSLEGASTLFNTYWIRFPYRGMTFETAVENTRTLLRAARKAGVRRIDGLMASLLISKGPPTCPTALSSWLQSNADLVGRTYTSELAKRFGGPDGGG